MCQIVSIVWLHWLLIISLIIELTSSSWITWIVSLSRLVDLFVDGAVILLEAFFCSSFWRKQKAFRWAIQSFEGCVKHAERWFYKALQNTRVRHGWHDLWFSVTYFGSWKGERVIPELGCLGGYVSSGVKLSCISQNHRQASCPKDLVFQFNYKC